MNSSGFVERWAKQRERGRWSYAAIHALMIGEIAILAAVVVQLTGMERPTYMSPQLIGFLAMGGFAYGLIRFNLRERFYAALIGDEHDKQVGKDA